MSRFSRLMFAVCTLLIISACDSDSDNVPVAQIEVSASLGLLTDATVTMTQADGTPLPGATGTTGSDGKATINYNANYRGPYVIRVAGNPNARYFDEATQTMVPFPDGQSIRAVGSTPGANVGVTILTELAAQVAESVGSGITAADIDNINESIRAAFAPDIADILTPPVIVGADNIASQSLGTDDASRYALRLAALAGIASGTDAPALTILTQLSADLADGSLDGTGPDGAIADLAYGTAGFVNAFTNAIQLAATTLANTDLSAVLEELNVVTDANILQRIIDAGVTLPSDVTDLITNGGGGTVVGDGDFNLTISGTISAAGIGTPFSLQLSGVPAPTPGDTDAITDVVNSTVTGLEGIADFSVSIVNNTASQVTFDVTLTAQQAGTSVSLDLRYDYVSTGDNTNPDAGDGTNGGTDGGTNGGTDGGTNAGTGGGDNFCFSGDPTPATLPASLSASVLELTYQFAQPGSPFADGDQKDFLVSSSGKLFIDNVEVAENPVLCGGNEREAVWKDNTADLTYAISDITGDFNEINIGRPSDNTFLGQFAVPEDPADAGPPALLTALAGTYSTRVSRSCSGDTCPNSTSVGETVTVIIGDDGTVTFAELVLDTQAANAEFRDFRENTNEPRLLISNDGAVAEERFELNVYVEETTPVGFNLLKRTSCGGGCSQSKSISVDVVPLPDEVTAFFDDFIAAMPTNITIVQSDPDSNSIMENLTNTGFGADAKCRSFELNAEKDRSAVPSSRNRTLFSWFSGSNGGMDFERKNSRYKVDAETGNRTLSLLGAQLIIRADGTIDIEEGLQDTTSLFVEEVDVRGTNDAAEIATACADYANITVSLTSTQNGTISVSIIDTDTGDTSQTLSSAIDVDNGNTFEFVLPTGTNYEVEVTRTSPTTLSCTVTNATGTVASTDITDVSIACQPGG